jgi:hypothetical protein
VFAPAALNRNSPFDSRATQDSASLVDVESALGKQQMDHEKAIARFRGAAGDDPLRARLQSEDR